MGVAAIGIGAGGGCDAAKREKGREAGFFAGEEIHRRGIGVVMIFRKNKSAIF